MHVQVSSLVVEELRSLVRPRSAPTKSPGSLMCRITLNKRGAR